MHKDSHPLTKKRRIRAKMGAMPYDSMSYEVFFSNNRGIAHQEHTTHRDQRNKTRGGAFSVWGLVVFVNNSHGLNTEWRSLL